MTKAPFDECSLDVIGPLPEDKDGNKFIIVMIVLKKKRAFYCTIASLVVVKHMNRCFYHRQWILKSL